MKLNYKVYLVLSLIFIIVFIVLSGKPSGNSFIFLGLGIGAGIRAIYEFFKKEKQTP